MPVNTVCAYRLVKSMSIPKQTKNIRSSMLTKVTNLRINFGLFSLRGRVSVKAESTMAQMFKIIII